jgi:hypothetical protein
MLNRDIIIGDYVGEGIARIDLQLDNGKVNTIMVKAYYKSEDIVQLLFDNLPQICQSHLV